MKNRIRDLRDNKKMTLDDLSKATGIKRGTLNNYELGKTEPKLATWQKLADYFDVSVPYLQGIKSGINKLSNIRKQKHLTKSELSNKFNSYVKNNNLNLDAITSKEISSWENGKENPNFKTWDILSNILDTPVMPLMGIDTDVEIAPFLKIKEDGLAHLELHENIEKDIKETYDQLPEELQFGFDMFNNNWKYIDEMAFIIPKEIINNVNMYFLDLLKQTYERK